MFCRVKFNFFNLGDREEVRQRGCDSQLFGGELLDTPLLEIPFNFEEFIKSELARILRCISTEGRKEMWVKWFVLGSSVTEP